MHDGDAPFTMERIGKISESSRKFDIEFWQRQGSTAIFAAAWEMVVEAYRWIRRGEPNPDLGREPAGKTD